MRITQLVAELERLREEHGDIEVWAAFASLPEMKITSASFVKAGQHDFLRSLNPRDYHYPDRVVFELKDTAPAP